MRFCRKLPRLLLDSRVVDVTMSYNPIYASCILLETPDVRTHLIK
jgi:hypothetical protein